MFYGIYAFDRPALFSFLCILGIFLWICYFGILKQQKDIAISLKMQQSDHIQYTENVGLQCELETTDLAEEEQTTVPC